MGDEWNPNGGGANSGTVKMWMNTKGYGFIINDADQTEIFCHHGDIGGRSLVKGGSVTYDVGSNKDGQPKAVNVSGAVGPRDPSGKGKKGKGGGGWGGDDGGWGADPWGVSAPEEKPWNPNGGGAISGTVKLWLGNKGCGFITSDEGEDIFCHHSDIGGRSLIKGGAVTFDMGTNPQDGKPKAINVSGAVGPRIHEDSKGGKNGDKGGKGAVVAFSPYGSPGKGKGGGGKKGGIPMTRPTTAEVHVNVPQAHNVGDKASFTLAGMKYEVDVPSHLWGGETFVVSI